MLAEVAVSTSSRDSAVHIWDIRNGALLATLKGNTCAPGAAAVVPAVGTHLAGTHSAPVQAASALPGDPAAAADAAALPGTAQASAHAGPLSGSNWSSGEHGWMLPSLLIAAQSDRASVNAWSFSKAQPVAKSIVPERLACIAVANSGRFCAAGGISGRLYLWELASGNLMRMFDAHYKPVKTLRFTADDAWLLSGGEDAMIHVWALNDLLNESMDHQELPPKIRSLKGHTLPIWDLATGTALVTVVFPRPLTCIAVDALETTVFAGSVDGTIRAVDLVRSANGSLRAIADGDIRDAEAEPRVFRSHTAAITCLSPSMDESLLVSGSEDGDCIVWDTSTRQPLRAFKAHKEPVSTVHVVLKPPGVGNPDAPSRVHLEQLKRFPVPRRSVDPGHTDGAAHAPVPVLPSRGIEALNDSLDTDNSSDAAYLIASVRQSAATQDAGGVAGPSELEILRSRLALVEKHNEELRRLNEELCESIVSRAL
nr:Pre-rRNA-processing protein ipi3 [Polyrhizophydium stewartii]